MKQIKINIKGQPYIIRYVNNLYGHSGVTNTANKYIHIQETEDAYELQKTIIHELIHAYFNECGLIEFSVNEILAYWFESHFQNINNDFVKIFQTFEPDKINYKEL